MDQQPNQGDGLHEVLLLVSLEERLIGRRHEAQPMTERRYVQYEDCLCVQLVRDLQYRRTKYAAADHNQAAESAPQQHEREEGHVKVTIDLLSLIQAPRQIKH